MEEGEEDEIHCIINLEKYAAYIRKNAAFSFAKNETMDESEDLEAYVTVKQTCQMIEDNAIGKDDDGRYMITEKGCKNLFEQLRTRIYNSGLSKLAAKNLLECYWDNEKNTMVFWSKDSEEPKKSEESESE